MKTPPHGVPILRSEQDIPAPGTEVNLYLPDTDVPQSAQDIFVLGHFFARPCGLTDRGSDKNAQARGRQVLNNLFLASYRYVAGDHVRLDAFHRVIGRFETSFPFPYIAPGLSTDHDAWHEVILKSFFLDILKTSNPTAGKALARLWKHNMHRFSKAVSQLHDVSTHPTTDEYSRAAALRVFGYTASFFEQCNRTITQGIIDRLAFFQTHQSPLVATTAMLSFRTLSRI